MPFSERDKLIALAIVHIFETSKPFGDYSAVAVLNDGAGISYGINQFTHRSGSLEAVIQRFNKKNAERGKQEFFQGYHAKLGDRSPGNILRVSEDQRLKNGLQFVADREEMREAQREIAFEKYLKPALAACDGSDFELPMSLAVIYDSINHGSYAKIRDRVKIVPPGNGSMKEIEFEKAWITRYVMRRDQWLEGIGRLAKTDYRTDFFIEQIRKGNWNLDMPMLVQGFRLTDAILGTLPQETFADLTEDEIKIEIPTIAAVVEQPADEPLPNPPNEPADRKTDSANLLPDAAQPPPPVVGDQPDAKPSSWFNVEDWKPMVFRWLKRIWGGNLTANAGQTVANLVGAVKDPEHWYIYAAIAVGVLVLLVGAAMLISLPLLVLWLWNRREILHLKSAQFAAMADPNQKNIGLIFERK